ncbi:aldose 1-epimerase [Reticulibacter mediterranei]|uniref:Aldose 1-epimerase n=1 Tax=Reticulibacter mediterranei TaxID=2778369 RepID=A0A8J3INJ3_9CHLR|nr:hypothetical protein [Reticulibacter mediterranei]GHO93601.1 aldose 1-epimerase [Reticulibacter mediterranei]
MDNALQIASGPVQAIVRAGALHSFSVDGHEFLPPFDGKYAAGSVLSPFPNRVNGGRYQHNGTSYQLQITEPGNQNALAGLLGGKEWEVVGHQPDALTVRTTLDGSDEGYPFLVSIEVSYEVSASQILVTTKTTNTGSRPAPYGVGFHPYVQVPGTSLNECTLLIPAASMLPVDNRQIPLGTKEPVAGGSYDFRAARPIGETVIDHCFTDLTKEPDGFSYISLSAGRAAITLFMDVPFLQVYTADTLPPDGYRRAIALEPQSCAPDAFNNHMGLSILDPGDQHIVTWGLRVTRYPVDRRP